MAKGCPPATGQELRRMKFVKSFLAGLLGLSVAQAVVVEFAGSGTYLVQTGTWPNYTNNQVPFSVTFSYDSSTPIIDSYPTQKTFAGLSLGLTVYNLDGSVKFSHTQTTGVRMVMDNALNGGSTDGFTVTTGFFTEAQSLALPRWNISGTDYRVTNFSFQLQENSGGLFPDGNFSLPTSPTFMGTDLSGYELKHAKLYIFNGSTDVAIFNNPLTTLGAPAAVPEPSTWAAILGGAALAGAAWQRRRKSEV